MDAEKFTAQLVQFSSVEQAIETNSRLRDLASMMSMSQIGDALGFVGRNVEFEGDVLTLTGDGGATIGLDLPARAASSRIDIVNSDGVVVRSIDAPTEAGVHRLTWDGLRTDGSRASPGTYTLRGKAEDAEGEPMDVVTRSTGRVGGVESDGRTAQLIVDGRAVPLSTVRAVADGQQPTTSPSS